MECKQKTDFDVEREIADHLDAIMYLLKLNRTSSNEDTPARIAKMWNREVFSNRNDRCLAEFEKTMKVFDNTEGYKGRLLTVKDIPFNSMCEHHFMPFSGTVSVGYVPLLKIIGLSKIPRIVRYFSKMPQLQERYTVQIAKYLYELVDPFFVAVDVKAKHSCVSCRGIELPSETHTMYYTGSAGCGASNEEKYLDEFMKAINEG